MKVLIATGQKELDQFLGKLVQSPLPPVAYKEGVQALCERHKPDVVILSAFLDGNIKNKDLLYQLRKHGARVIVLIGHTEPEEIRKEWIPLGVYDYITDPVKEEKIRLALEYPATLGMAEEKLQQIERGEIKEESKEEPNPRRSLFMREKKEKKQEESSSQTKFNQSLQLPLQTQQEKTQPQTSPVGTQWSFETLNTSDYTKQKKTVQPKQEPVKRAELNNDLERKTEQRQEEKREQQPVQVFKFEQESKEHRATHDQLHRDHQQKQQDSKTEDNEHNHSQKKMKQPPEQHVTSVWNFQMPVTETNTSAPLPKGYNVVILSPAPTGKTYIAMNLAATFSKQGAKTELVAFEGHDDIWQYFDLPMMEPGSPQGLPNLIVSPFKKMVDDAQYRVIDLPYDEWDHAKEWEDALFLYVTDMDVVHHRQAERGKEKWQGRKVLQVLNRFVSNVLDGGQEQKIRFDADIVFDDQPGNFLAMRFGRPVIATSQSAAREFEMAAKTVQEALPKSGQNNLYVAN